MAVPVGLLMIGGEFDLSAGDMTGASAIVMALLVVLPGDLALRRAVQAAYRLDHLPSHQEILDAAEKWRPYRSLATSYLFSAAFDWS